MPKPANGTGVGSDRTPDEISADQADSILFEALAVVARRSGRQWAGVGHIIGAARVQLHGLMHPSDLEWIGPSQSTPHDPAGV